MTFMEGKESERARKLKTLKDLEKSHCEWLIEMGEQEEAWEIQHFNSHLKAEAVKWVKEHDWVYDSEKDDWFNVPDTLNYSHIDSEFQAICEWIKFFFNITEEDLE